MKRVYKLFLIVFIELINAYTFVTHHVFIMAIYTNMIKHCLGIV